MYVESIALQQTRTGFSFSFNLPTPRFTLYGVMTMPAGPALSGRWENGNCKGGDKQGSTGYRALGLPWRDLCDDACAQAHSHYASVPGQ